jgi:hypothetical protein
MDAWGGVSSCQVDVRAGPASRVGTYPMMDVSRSTIGGRRCGGTTSWISVMVSAWFGCGTAWGVCIGVSIGVGVSVLGDTPPCARGEVSAEERGRVYAVFGVWDGEDEMERAWGIVQRGAREGAFGECTRTTRSGR